MKKKIIGAGLILIILLFSIFAFLIQREVSDIKEKLVDVTEIPLSVKILSDTSIGTSPLTVDFGPLLSISNKDFEFIWDFGDGNTSIEKKPNHIYKTGETYNVYNCKLTVIDGNMTIYDSLNITVTPNEPPKIKILVDTTVNRPATVKFDAQVFDPEGEELEYKWVLRHPDIMGVIEPEDTFTEKTFSKFLIRSGRYVVELRVTDESGTVGTDYEVVQVKKHQFELLFFGITALLATDLPDGLNLVWRILNGKEDKLKEHIDDNWFDWPQNRQDLVMRLIEFAKIEDYEPPLPKADLDVSTITDVDLSSYVNNSTGLAGPRAMEISSFTIVNNETSDTVKNIYVSLIHPISEIEGLNDVIEVEDLTVGLEVGQISNKLFYNGKYTKWEDCYKIEELSPGTIINMGISVALKEGVIFKKGTYQCTLYIYQERALEKHEPVDEIPFKIIL